MVAIQLFTSHLSNGKENKMFVLDYFCCYDNLDIGLNMVHEGLNELSSSANENVCNCFY